MEQVTKQELLFSVTREWLQEEAKRTINRDLNDSEIATAKKCIDFGLSTGIDTVFRAAIQEAVRVNAIPLST